MRRSLAVLAFFLARPVLADEPPSWKSFTVSSASGACVAVVERDPAGDPKAKDWEAPWRVRVHRVGDAPGVAAGDPLWTAPWHATGYAGGRLSDDGACLVQVEDWYGADAPVLVVYAKGAEPRKIAGGALGIPGSKLATTASHRRWLDPAQPAAPFVDDGQVFEVAALDGRPRGIELATGRVVGPRNGPFRATLSIPGQARPGAPIPMTFGVVNVSAAAAPVWHTTPWVNMRVSVTGPDGKEAPLTDLGRRARGLFGGLDRDKNASFPLDPGKTDERLDCDLRRLFRIDLPGRYEVSVRYADDCNGAAVDVVSNPVAFHHVPESWGSLADLAEALYVAADGADPDTVRSLLGPAAQGENGGSILRVLKDHDFRALARTLDGIGAAEMTLGGHPHGHLHIQVVKAGSGWKVDVISWCK